MLSLLFDDLRDQITAITVHCHSTFQLVCNIQWLKCIIAFDVFDGCTTDIALLILYAIHKNAHMDYKPFVLKDNGITSRELSKHSN